jgi:hypothetical protein
MLPARAKSRNPGVKRTKVSNCLLAIPAFDKDTVQMRPASSLDKVT